MKGDDSPTMPKRMVKRGSMMSLAYDETEGAQPRRREAAAGLGQTSSVTKAGAVELKKPQQKNWRRGEGGVRMKARSRRQFGGGKGSEGVRAYRRLNLGLLLGIQLEIDGEEEVFCPQGHDPEIDADAEGEDAAEGDEVSGCFQPSAHGRYQAGEGDGKGGEDESRVGNGGDEGEAVVENGAGELASIFIQVVDLAAGDEGEAQLQTAGCEKDNVGHEGGNEDVVGHDGQSSDLAGAPITPSSRSSGGVWRGGEERETKARERTRLLSLLVWREDGSEVDGGGEERERESERTDDRRPEAERKRGGCRRGQALEWRARGGERGM